MGDWRHGQESPIRVGISACLLGQRVRFDGGHKRDSYLVETLGRWFNWVPVCPEVEVGLGVPRPSLRLATVGGEVRLMEPKGGRDLTETMRQYAAERVARLAELDLCGYILKKDSPSCGMERVKVYGEGMPRRQGRGVFAAVLMERLPLLPVEEEGRLSNPKLRENFVERVFAYRRLKLLFSGEWDVGELVAFHTAHKLQLMAHNLQLFRQLGQLVAVARQLPPPQLRQQYETLFMRCLATPATTRKNTNVLQHMAGYFKKVADPADRQELHQSIEDYRQELVPLVVPLTLFRHFIRAYQVPYLAGQTFLEPHPKELMLRNHV
ncbi:MAG: DUF523 and DUF1722 domain-containing protein [Thermoanaerobaculum sp.]|nr:DUF523 and DUF1722 domain-containing protein [Thermoanaerobaculum sp.]